MASHSRDTSLASVPAMDTQRTARPVEVDDLDALVTLARAADTALWGRPETDRAELTEELASVEDLAAATRLLHDGQGRALGYALVWGAECRLVLHPTPEGMTRETVATELLGWALGAGASQLDVAAPDTPLIATAERLHLTHRHTSYELLRSRRTPLRPPPAGVRITDLDGDRDPERVHAMLYAFWAEIPTHHARPLAQWRRLFVDHEPAARGPQLVAWEDGEVVGAVLTRVYTGTTGWILQLGVTPSARGRGLGAHLLGRAADDLAAVPGVAEVGLSVDADNRSALTLYHRTGFEVDRAYLRLVAQPQTERSSG